jgi:hypothetical protein
VKYALVRRATAQSLAPTNSPGEIQPARRHSNDGIFVQSQLVTGFDPQLHLEWSVMPSLWRMGYSLMVFRSATGFCPERYPDDMTKHGQLIIETYRDDELVEYPPEGTQFYSFILHKKKWLGLLETMRIVRFSVTVPSAKVAIGRIKDALELDELLKRKELRSIEHVAHRNELKLRRIRSRQALDEARAAKQLKGVGSDEETLVDEELAAIDAIVDTFLARRDKIAELKKSPRFRSLRPKEKAEVLKRVEEQLDPSEISARRNQRY